MKSLDKKYKPRLTLAEKLKVIESVENGKKVAEICRERELSHSTVSSIIQNSAKLKKQGLHTAEFRASLNGTVKSTLMMEMERGLLVWIEKQTKNNMPISLKETQFWAQSHFEWLKKALKIKAKL